MRKGILLAIFGSFFTISGLNAQKIQAPAPEKNDPQAQRILDRVRKKYESYKSFEGNFSWTVEVPGQPKEVQKGVFGQEGDKFKLEMPDQVIVNDTKTTWVYLKKNNEVQINDSEPSSSDAGFLTPKELLRRYQKGDFLFALTDKTTVGAKVLTLIEFKPKDRKSEYAKIRLSIDEKTASIQSIFAVYKDGTRINFNVTKFAANKVLPSNYFVFDSKKYPGVRVEDLRM